LRTVNIYLRNEGPVVVRYIIIVIKSHIQAHVRAKRCPAVIIITAAPVNPGWSPFVIGYPFPAIIIIKPPAAIMKRSPAPFIVRYPGITIFGHYPMAVSGIRPEIVIHIGYPYAAVIGVIYPGTVRLELIVKVLKGDLLVLSFSFIRHCQ
jgi:hypothetical protein